MTTTINQRYYFLLECIRHLGKTSCATILVLDELLKTIDRNNEVERSFAEISSTVDCNLVIVSRAVRSLREAGVLSYINRDTRKFNAPARYRVNFDAWEDA